MSISTLSFNTSTRTSLLRLQTQIAESQQEINTGRHSDVGRTLGRLTGAAVNARAQETSFDERQTSNGIVAQRIENIDASLESIYGGAERMSNSIIGISVATQFGTLVTEAKSGLQQMVGALNTTSDGQALFGGINTDEAPIKYDVVTAPSVAATRFGAFVAATTAGTVGGVTEGEMTAYLSDTGFVGTDGLTYRYKDLFEADWASQWSNASVGGQINSNISSTETIVSSANANDQAFRDIAAAYSAIADFNIGSLGETTRKVVASFATDKLTKANRDITTQRADFGVRLGRIDAANDELKRQEDIMRKTVSTLEDVDITEAGVRITALENQLKAAYTVTGRIQNLSLLNYI